MNVYQRLFGLKKVIPATWPYSTHLGGSIMPPEVIDAMNEAAKSWVDMHELLKRAGEIVAEICGAEAAFITSGATAGLTLAAAACMTGTDIEKMKQLPNTEGLKNEIIIQRGRITEYCSGFKVAGAKIVEVGCCYPYLPIHPSETSLWTFGNRPEDIESAINEKTAAIADTQSFLCVQRDVVPLEDLIKIAKKHDIPVIVDAAGELPPVSNLRKFTNMGCDLVVFSGGKAICGPNNTGFILGKKDLIEACSLQSSPHYDRFMIGRGFKLKKEDIVGLVVALKRFVTLDFEKIIVNEQSKARYVFDQFREFRYVKAELIYPDETNRPICTIQLTLDEEALGIKAKDVARELVLGDPSIHIFHVEPLNILRIYVHNLQDGEEKLVVQKLKGVLSQKVR